MKTAFLIGRLIFGGFFLYNGIHHFQKRNELAQYVATKQVPLPEVAVAATGATLVLGGASVVLGVKPKLGALAIAGFLAGVSPIMHDFWKQDDPQQRQNQMAHFMKNVALLGAAMALMGRKEPWPVSVPLGRPSVLEQVRRFTREVAA